MPINWEQAAKGFAYPVIATGGHVEPFASGWRVVDGDTIEVQVDRGWKDLKRVKVRPPDLDVPESNTEAGEVVSKVMYHWLSSAGPLWLLSGKLDGRGRVLGDLFDSDGYCWSELLIENDFCKQYDGRKRRPGWTQEELDRVEQKALNWIDAWT